MYRVALVSHFCIKADLGLVQKDTNSQVNILSRIPNIPEFAGLNGLPCSKSLAFLLFPFSGRIGRYVQKYQGLVPFICRPLKASVIQAQGAICLLLGSFH